MSTAGKNLSAYNKANLGDAASFNIGIVVAAWNAEITENLFRGAYDTLVENGVPTHQITRQTVPGAVELTYGAAQLCKTNRFDAVIVIGCVIQGETRHFDFVCESVAQGTTHLNASQNTPVIFCVLTDNTLQQSIDRSGGKHGNKGVEAAIAAIEMAAIKRKFL